MINEIVHIPKRRYIYFNEKGEILGIDNSIDSAQQHYAEFDLEDVVDFLTGKKSTDMYRVVFSKKDKTYILCKIDNAVDFVNAKFNKVATDIKEYDIKITQDVVNQVWVFSVKKNHIAQVSFLYFSITEHNNPFALKRIIKINNQYLGNEDIAVPFSVDNEKKCSSIYVKDIYYTYLHEEIDE